MMKKMRKYTLIFAMVMCLGMGITALASTATGNLVYNSNIIGSGHLEKNGYYGTSTTYSNSSNGRYAFVSVFAYNKKGTAIKGDTNIGSLTAVKSINADKAHHFRGTSAIKRSSDNRPLCSTTLYAY